MLPACVLLWLFTAQVPAPTDMVDVQWIAPPTCPDRDALLAAVAQRLGRPLAPGEARVEARVVGDAGRGYTLHLTLAAGDRGETRDVHDPSCAALTDAAAVRVVAALASSPVVPPPPTVDAEPVDPIETPAEAPATPPVVVDPAPATPPQPDPEDRSKRPGGVFRLHGGGEFGAMPGATGPTPGPTGAVGLALGLLWPRLRVELHGTLLAPRSSGDVRARLLAVAAHGCGRVGRGAIEVPLCVGLEVGRMRGEASKLPEAQPATSWWLAAVLGPGLAWHVGSRVSVWASLQLVLAPVRPQFVQGGGDDPPVLFTPSAASGRLLVGVELRLRDRW